MYLYILEAFNLPDKDLMSKSDPYLIVKIGEKVLNVIFYIMYSLKANTFKTMKILSSIKKYIKLLNYLKMQYLKSKYGTMIRYWETIS